MKKNKMMRIASVLLVAVLISTCAISGTFAKYITKAEGEDTARVAKWGILLGIEGEEVFGTEYEAQDAKYKAAFGEGEKALSVVSSTEDKVVAPGTSSEILGTNLVATVAGTPEVATRYTLVAKKLSDIVLPADNGYTDYTELVKGTDGYAYSKTFDLAKDYTPVKWNMIIEGKGKTIDLASELYAAMVDAGFEAQLNAYGFTEKGVSIFSAVQIIKKVAGNALYKQVVEGVLASQVSHGRNFQLDVTTETVDNETYDVLTMSYDFDPNKDMDFTFTLGWEWIYETDTENHTVDDNDRADTYLGNMIVAKLDGAPADSQLAEDYEAFTGSLVIAASFTATAVQID